VTAPATVRWILQHLGLPTVAPRPHAARSPPQMELEDTQVDAEDFYPDPPCPDW